MALHAHDLVATIDVDHRAGDAATAIAGKEDTGLTEFFTGAGATEGRAFLPGESRSIESRPV